MFVFCVLCLMASSIVAVDDDPENEKNLPSSKLDLPTNNTVTNTFKLPMNFDARMKWINVCPLISEVKNQGRCKSGWAIAVTSVINDRRCIKSLDATSLPLSPMMLLSCCPNCCGCSGGNGHVLNAWKFTRDVGLVTGTMNSDNILQPDDGCQPYMIKPLKISDLHKSSTQSLQTPLCVKKKCTNPYYQPNEEKLTYFKIDSFKLFSRIKPEEIMKELFTNGPIQVSFNIYEDFRDYNADGKCSVYIHSWGTFEGEHAGKLIGWGTENKIKYWLVMNSFGPYWGCNGTFKVPRTGIDNMEFGYAIVAPTVSGADGAISVMFIFFFWCILVCNNLI